jgi:hypothetical protein
MPPFFGGYRVAQKIIFLNIGLSGKPFALRAP